MRPATAQELPEEQTLFTRSWDLVKRYANITQADEDAWEKLYKEAESMHGKGGSEAVKALSGAVLDGIMKYLTIKSKESKEPQTADKKQPKLRKDKECVRCKKMFECKGKPENVLHCLNLEERKLPE